MLKKKKLAPSPATGSRLTANAPAARTASPSPAPAPVPDVIDAEAIPAHSPMDRLLRPEEVAQILGVSERTLERWRMEGSGPRYLSLSRKVVRYEAGDLRTFLDDRGRSNTAA
ncbi:helix-turn-helix transcriptional regulator [Novispirillum sp. DQ9]|uniref:helix-turn-helix transcriptional regulator n=1 Tax=Novispirillum sp. DQ9 TaxID=3398612 RepID=UPI003C7EB50D